MNNEKLMSAIQVAIRVRPSSDWERSESEDVVTVEADVVSVHEAGLSEGGLLRRIRARQYAFDYCFGPTSSQEQLFTSLSPILLNAFACNRNGSVIAYGQTGSGKTFTMLGDVIYPGLIPRICEACINLNTSNEQDHFEVSFYEIYNDKVRDLLSAYLLTTSTLANPKLRVREHPTLGPYIQGLSWHHLDSAADLSEILNIGCMARSSSATPFHSSSSRSHAIFSIRQKCRPAAKMNFVDLAGSERHHASGTKEQIRETAYINKSLATLGSVILALSSKSGKRPCRHIPYRDSTLTWLLKDSIGGQSKTVMIGTIAPSSKCRSETLNTLRYAHKARHIVNRVTVFDQNSLFGTDDPHSVISDLKAEIARLRAIINNGEHQISTIPDVKIENPESNPDSICWETNDPNPNGSTGIFPTRELVSRGMMTSPIRSSDDEGSVDLEEVLRSPARNDEWFIHNQALNSLIIPPPVKSRPSLSSADKYDDFWHPPLTGQQEIDIQSNQDRSVIFRESDAGSLEIDARNLVDQVMDRVVKEYAHPRMLSETTDEEIGHIPSLGQSFSNSHSQFPSIKRNGLLQTASEMNTTSTWAASGGLLTDQIDSLFLSPAMNRKKLEGEEVFTHANGFDSEEENGNLQSGLMKGSLGKEYVSQNKMENNGNPFEPDTSTSDIFPKSLHPKDHQKSNASSKVSHGHHEFFDPAEPGKPWDSDPLRLFHSGTHATPSKSDIRGPSFEIQDLESENEKPKDTNPFSEIFSPKKIEKDDKTHKADSDLDDFFDQVQPNKALDSSSIFKYHFDTLESSTSTLLNQSTSTNIPSSESSQIKPSSLMPEDMFKQNLKLHLLDEIEDQSPVVTPHEGMDGRRSTSTDRVRSAKKVVRARAELRLLRRDSGSSEDIEDTEDIEGQVASKMYGGLMTGGVNRVASGKVKEKKKAQKDGESGNELLKVADDADSDWPSYNGDSFESEHDEEKLEIKDGQDENRLLQSSIISASQLAHMKLGTKKEEDVDSIAEEVPTENEMEEKAHEEETKKVAQAFSADSLLSELSPVANELSDGEHSGGKYGHKDEKISSKLPDSDHKGSPKMSDVEQQQGQMVEHTLQVLGDGLSVVSASIIDVDKTPYDSKVVKADEDIWKKKEFQESARRNSMESGSGSDVPEEIEEAIDEESKNPIRSEMTNQTDQSVIMADKKTKNQIDQSVTMAHKLTKNLPTAHQITHDDQDEISDDDLDEYMARLSKNAKPVEAHSHTSRLQDFLNSKMDQSSASTNGQQNITEFQDMAHKNHATYLMDIIALSPRSPPDRNEHEKSPMPNLVMQPIHDGLYDLPHLDTPEQPKKTVKIPSNLSGPFGSDDESENGELRLQYPVSSTSIDSQSSDSLQAIKSKDSTSFVEHPNPLLAHFLAPEHVYSLEPLNDGLNDFPFPHKDHVKTHPKADDLEETNAESHQKTDYSIFEVKRPSITSQKSLDRQLSKESRSSEHEESGRSVKGFFTNLFGGGKIRHSTSLEDQIPQIDVNHILTLTSDNLNELEIEGLASLASSQGSYVVFDPKNRHMGRMMSEPGTVGDKEIMKTRQTSLEEGTHKIGHGITSFMESFIKKGTSEGSVDYYNIGIEEPNQILALEKLNDGLMEMKDSYGNMVEFRTRRFSEEFEGPEEKARARRNVISENTGHEDKNWHKSKSMDIESSTGHGGKLIHSRTLHGASIEEESEDLKDFHRLQKEEQASIHRSNVQEGRHFRHLDHSEDHHEEAHDIHRTETEKSEEPKADELYENLESQLDSHNQRLLHSETYVVTGNHSSEGTFGNDHGSQSIEKMPSGHTPAFLPMSKLWSFDGESDPSPENKEKSYNPFHENLSVHSSKLHLEPDGLTEIKHIDHQSPDFDDHWSKSTVRNDHGSQPIERITSEIKHIGHQSPDFDEKLSKDTFGNALDSRPMEKMTSEPTPSGHTPAFPPLSKMWSFEGESKSSFESDQSPENMAENKEKSYNPFHENLSVQSTMLHPEPDGLTEIKHIDHQSPNFDDQYPQKTPETPRDTKHLDRHDYQLGTADDVTDESSPRTDDDQDVHYIDFLKNEAPPTRPYTLFENQPPPIRMQRSKSGDLDEEIQKLGLTKKFSTDSAPKSKESDTESSDSLENGSSPKKSHDNPAKETDDQPEPLSPFSQFMSLMEKLPDNQDYLYSIQEEDEEHSHTHAQANPQVEIQPETLSKPHLGHSRPYIPPLELDTDDDTSKKLQNDGLRETETDSSLVTAPESMQTYLEAKDIEDHFENSDRSSRESFSDFVDKSVNPMLVPESKAQSSNLFQWNSSGNAIKETHSVEVHKEDSAENSILGIRKSSMDHDFELETSLNRSQTSLQPNTDDLLGSFSSKGSLQNSFNSKPPLSPMSLGSPISPISKDLSRNIHSRISNNSDFLESSNEMIIASPSKEAKVVQFFQQRSQISMGSEDNVDKAIEKKIGEVVGVDHQNWERFEDDPTPEISSKLGQHQNSHDKKSDHQNSHDKTSDQGQKSTDHIKNHNDNVFEDDYSPRNRSPGDHNRFGIDYWSLKRPEHQDDHPAKSDHSDLKKSHENSDDETPITPKYIGDTEPPFRQKQIPLCYCKEGSTDQCILCKPWILTMDITGLIENLDHENRLLAFTDPISTSSSYWNQKSYPEGKDNLKLTSTLDADTQKMKTKDEFLSHSEDESPKIDIDKIEKSISKNHEEISSPLEPWPAEKLRKELTESESEEEDWLSRKNRSLKSPDQNGKSEVKDDQGLSGVFETGKDWSTSRDEDEKPKVEKEDVQINKSITEIISEKASSKDDEVVWYEEWTETTPSDKRQDHKISKTLGGSIDKSILNPRESIESDQESRSSTDLGHHIIQDYHERTDLGHLSDHTSHDQQSIDQVDQSIKMNHSDHSIKIPHVPIDKHADQHEINLHLTNQNSEVEISSPDQSPNHSIRDRDHSTNKSITDSTEHHDQYHETDHLADTQSNKPTKQNGLKYSLKSQSIEECMSSPENSPIHNLRFHTSASPNAETHSKLTELSTEIFTPPTPIPVAPIGGGPRMYANLSDDEDHQKENMEEERQPLADLTNKEKLSLESSGSMDSSIRPDEAPLCFGGSLIPGQDTRVINHQSDQGGTSVIGGGVSGEDGRHQSNIASIFSRMEDVLKVTVVDGVPHVSMSSKMETERHTSDSDEEAENGHVPRKSSESDEDVNGNIHMESYEKRRSMDHHRSQISNTNGENHNDQSHVTGDQFKKIKTPAGIDSSEQNITTNNLNQIWHRRDSDPFDDQTDHTIQNISNHIQKVKDPDEIDIEFTDDQKEINIDTRMFELTSDDENGPSDHDLIKPADFDSDDDFADAVKHDLPKNDQIGQQGFVYSAKNSRDEDDEIDDDGTDIDDLMDELHEENGQQQIKSSDFTYNDYEDETDIKAYTIHLNSDEEEPIGELNQNRLQIDQRRVHGHPSPDTSPNGHSSVRKTVSWSDLGRGGPLEQGPTVNKMSPPTLKPIIKTKTSPRSEDEGSPVNSSTARPLQHPNQPPQPPPRPPRPSSLFTRPPMNFQDSIVIAKRHAYVGPSPDTFVDTAVQTDQSSSGHVSRTNAVTSPFPDEPSAARFSREMAPSPTNVESIDNLNTYNGQVLLGDLMALVHERDTVLEALEVFLASSTSPALQHFASYSSQRYIHEYAHRLRTTKAELDKRIDDLVNHLKKLYLDRQLAESLSWLFTRHSANLTFKNPPSKSSILGGISGASGVGTLTISSFSTSTFTKFDNDFNTLPCPRLHLSPLDYRQKLLELRKTLVQTCTDLATTYADSIIHDTFYNTAFSARSDEAGVRKSTDMGFYQRLFGDQDSSPPPTKPRRGQGHQESPSQPSMDSGYGSSWLSQEHNHRLTDNGAMGNSLLNEIRELRQVSREAINSGKDALRSSGFSIRPTAAHREPSVTLGSSHGFSQSATRPKSMTAEDSKIDAEIASLLRMYRQKLLGVDNSNHQFGNNGF